jgi:predicted RNase H-like nuclease (RuvC/YqgF family)
MKKIVNIVSVFALVALLGSCAESSKKYKALEAERDSLLVVTSNVTTDFESSLRTINEIEMALQTVREAESIIIMENQEGNNNYAVSQIEAIDRTIKQNKAKIEELEKQLADAGSKSKQLNATINRLKKELDDKDALMTTLRNELNASKAQVVELTTKVEHLNKNVEVLTEDVDNLSAQSAEQQATIRLQDAMMNSVYYIVAPMETLKQYELVTGGGLFKKESVSNVINKNVLNVADRRELTTLPLNTKKANILTNHPESSYQITKNDDGMLSLVIVDKEAFWNISNYLIISIK